MIKDDELALKVFNEYVQRKHLIEEPEKSFWRRYIRIGTGWEDKIVVTAICQEFFLGKHYRMTIYTPDSGLELEISKSTFNIMWKSACKAYSEWKEYQEKCRVANRNSEYNKIRDKYL